MLLARTLRAHSSLKQALLIIKPQPRILLYLPLFPRPSSKLPQSRTMMQTNLAAKDSGIPDDDPPPYSAESASADIPHSQSISSNSSTELSGPLIIDGSIKCNGSLYLNGMIQVEGPVKVNGSVNIAGNVTIK